MKYPYEHPPPLRKFTLKMLHGGDIKTITTRKGKSYETYVKGEVLLFRNLYLEKASLVVFNEIAKHLGYKRSSRFWYKQPDGEFSEVRDDVHLSEIVKNELSVDRELNIYLVDGVREETQVEQAPTIMFWNCHGFNDEKLYEVQALNLIYQPNILFVIETRLPSTLSSKICCKLGFKDFRDSPATKHMEDSKGCVGLAMFWTKDVNLEFHDGSDNYLDFMVIVSDSERHRLIGFYGDPKDKNISWELLVQLSSTSTEDRWVSTGDRWVSTGDRWVAGGDFNEILQHKEKSGGEPKRQALLDAFQNALTTCKLKPLSYEGNIFTWEQKGIKERLDRVVARLPWEKFFPRHRVVHCTNGLTSDHIPILLETDSVKQRRKIMQSKVFSFIENVKQACQLMKGIDVTTVLRLERKMVDEMSEAYYKAIELVAPHLIQLKHIAVLDQDKVTFERLVTVKGVHNIRVLLLNSIDAPKPSRKYNLAKLPQFPSCMKDENISFNLSEYLAETWSLIKFIPRNGQQLQEHIVNEIIAEQVDNSITWLKQVSTRDGEPIDSELSNKLKEKASRIGRAVIVYDIIIYLLNKQMIEHEGAITQLQEKLCDACVDYFGAAMTEVDSEEKIGKPLQFLLKTFQWLHTEDDLQYRIPVDCEENSEYLFAEITRQMLEAERDAVVINDPWMQFIIEENGTEREKLVKIAYRGKIERQLDVLKDIGCISSCSRTDKIALSKDNRNPVSVVRGLKKATIEASKTLSKCKTFMTYNVYIHKLREVYKRSESQLKKKISESIKKKREMMADGEEHGEKKVRV